MFKYPINKPSLRGKGREGPAEPGLYLGHPCHAWLQPAESQRNRAGPGERNWDTVPGSEGVRFGVMKAIQCPVKAKASQEQAAAASGMPTAAWLSHFQVVHCSSCPGTSILGEMEKAEKRSEHWWKNKHHPRPLLELLLACLHPEPNAFHRNSPTRKFCSFLHFPQLASSILHNCAVWSGDVLC